MMNGSQLIKKNFFGRFPNFGGMPKLKFWNSEALNIFPMRSSTIMLDFLYMAATVWECKKNKQTNKQICTLIFVLDSVSISYEIHRISLTKINLVMIFGENVPLYSENQTKPSRVL
jgi:hypothetical protein